MKKLLMIGLLVYTASCTNPEDRATGDADSTTFNTNTENNLNTQASTDNPTTATPDSSLSPSTDIDNSNSSTNGTNRGYRSGRDSGK
jgi:hypothetical protein